MTRSPGPLHSRSPEGREPALSPELVEGSKGPGVRGADPPDAAGR